MNNTEAAAILSLADYDDLESCYDEKLFECKQFFTQKPIVGAVFRSKLEKLKVMKQAFLILGYAEEAQQPVELPEAFEPQAFIWNHVNGFDQFKATCKRKIHSLQSFDDFEHVIPFLLAQFYTYAQPFPDFDREIQPILGKEPDPMDFYHAVKGLVSLGIETWEGLRNLPVDLPDAFRSESKRLYLLAKKEEIWMTSLND